MWENLRQHKLIIIIGALIAIAAIVVCAAPLMTVPYVADVSYQDTETYYVKEPYTVREPYTRIERYTETEPYDKSVPIDYIVTDTGIYQWFWSTGSDVWVTIRNTDVKSGEFDVKFDLTLKGGATVTRCGSEYIAIGDTIKVKVTYAGGYVKSFDCHITPPTKTVTAYRDVERTREVTDYRDVTKYRNVPKQRTVTKTRQETRYKKVTILEYLVDYQ